MGNEATNKKDTLKQDAVSSTAWGLLDKGSNVVASFIIGIVLARLLPPSVFGLIGIAMIVIGFGQIFVNLGLGPALIQKQDITGRHIRVVFTTSVIAGIILMGIVYFSAPVTAAIFDNENVIPIVEALSVIFVIGGFQIPSRALLKKELDFRHIFYVSLGKSILYGIVSITLALLGFGVWSLVIGNIFQRLVSFLGSYWYVRHSLKPLLSKREFSDLFRFGSGETLSTIANYFALQGDYLMIGRLLGAHELGLYTKSYSLMNKPTSQFVRVLTDVLFPTASKIKADNDRLENVFLKAMKMIAFATLPIFVIIIILAPEIIIGLYGEKWEGAVLPLQILGCVGVFRAMYNAAGSFLKAKGWVYKIFYTQLIYGSSVLLFVWVGSIYFGLKGAALAVSFAIFLMWCMTMELNSRAIGIKRVDIYKTLKPGVIVAVALSTALYPIKELIAIWISSTIIQLLILAPVSLISTLLLCLILPQKFLSFLPAELLRMIKPYLPSFALANYSQLLIYLSK